MQRRPFARIMPFTVRIPIMRILMFIKSSVSIPIVKSVTTVFPLAQANVALERLRSGAVVGAAVLVPSNYAKA